MGLIAGLSLLALTLVSCSILVRLFKPESPTDAVLLFFLFLCSVTLLTGYATSLVGAFGSPSWWILSQLILLLVLVVPATRRRRGSPPLPRLRGKRFRSTLTDTLTRLSPEEKVVLYPPLLTLLFIGLLNAVLVIWVAPHTWDSMTYHLTRMAYYIQQGDLSFYDANYWAQVVHPKNATIMLAFSYVVSGENENLTQIVQFSSFWISAAAVYGISRTIGHGRAASLLSALTFGLLVSCLMESTTAQNDLLVAALSAVSLYFLFRATEARSTRLLFPSALALGIALGVKESAFLVVPSLAIVAVSLFLRWRSTDRGRKPLSVFALLLVVGILVFTLPSGYIENMTLFGHPFGPEEVRREHSFEGHPVNETLHEGSKNTLRYALDFLSLDGLPHTPVVTRSHLALRGFLVSGLREVGIDLTDVRGARVQFSALRMPSGHEDFSYWGVLGFSLVWVMVLLQLIGIPRPGPGRILAGAALLFFLVQCYAGPYDPWRGRYFITCAVFASPAVGYCLTWVRTRTGFLYLTLVLVLGCFSALSAVLLHPIDLELTPWVREQSAPSLLMRDRLQQLTTNNRLLYEPLTRLEETLPPTARVAVCLGSNVYEYPLFGEQLTRSLTPVSSFRGGVRPIPDDADFLLFTPDYFVPTPSDEFLGNRWYLRRLPLARGNEPKRD